MASTGGGWVFFKLLLLDNAVLAEMLQRATTNNAVKLVSRGMIESNVISGVTLRCGFSSLTPL